MQIGTSVTSLTALIAATSRAGSPRNLAHAFLPLDANQVHARDPGNLAHRRDQLNGDLDPFLGLPGGGYPFEAVHDTLRNMQPRHLLLHEAGTASRPRDTDGGGDEDLSLQIKFPDHVHESLEDGHVEDQLGLDEIGTRPDLFLQPQRAGLEGRRKWILDRSDEE